MLTDKERKKRATIEYKIREGIIIPILASALSRVPKRKPKEDREVYTRSRKNANKALKQRLKYGPGTQVYINKETIEVL